MDPLASVSEKLLDRRELIDVADARAVVALPAERLPELIALAHRVRLAYAGPGVDLESILSVKTGACPEDCHFCGQSSRFKTDLRPEPFLPPEVVLDAARDAEAAGVTEFCIVIAARGPDERTMRRVLEAVEAVRANTSLDVACSLGLLTSDHARRLAEAGVRRYNHNLETARSFFANVCTTHTWEERVETCRLVNESGMELCSGGILGMGETWEQRVEFAFELREMGPFEIPINFLDPRSGTPFAHLPLVQPLDALRAIALFRLVHPAALLRFAGGREVTLRDLQAHGMLAGVNGLIVGNYLTTLGRPPREDLLMLEDLEMPVKRLI